VRNFANRRCHSRASAEADDARGRTVSSKASSVDARANGPSRGAREREREREGERDERTIDRSVESISIIDHRNRRSDRSRGEGWILGEG